MTFISVVLNFILCIAAALFSDCYQIHMLQQNSYFPSRYLKWVADRGMNRIIAGGALLVINTLLYFTGLHYLQSALLIVLTIFEISHGIKLQRASIKPLVFTARIKRLYAALGVILMALGAAALFAAKGALDTVITVLFYILCFIPQIAVLLARALMAPVEKACAQWYVNDAKRILKSLPQLKIVGITGSYGKTTTKFILNRILSEAFNTVCTPQSFNTPMGVVRTVRSEIKPQTQVFVCEMGAKNIGDIKEICDIVHPDMGIITSVGPQHLDTFKNTQNVFSTKFELADAVRQKGGATFINLDSAEIKKFADLSDKSLIAFGEGCEFRAENISYGRSGSSFELVLNGERIPVTTKLLGLHSVADILAAAAAAHTLGVKSEDIRFAIGSLKPTEHRLELKQTPFGLLIDDAYNSNTEGCLEAVRVLSSFEGMQKAIITPGLIELGDREYDCNFALGVEAAKYCDIIILVGQNRSKPIKDGVLSEGFDEARLFVASSFKQAMQHYQANAQKGNSVVLLENDLPDNYLN